MVRVTFYNLLRSKYKINEITVHPGTIHDIIKQILILHPKIDSSDFTSSIIFYKGKPIHYRGFHTFIDDNETIIITHFVGGG